MMKMPKIYRLSYACSVGGDVRCPENCPQKMPKFFRRVPRVNGWKKLEQLHANFECQCRKKKKKIWDNYVSESTKISMCTIEN